MSGANQPFPPGTRVCRKTNLTKVGVVLNEPPTKMGPRYRQAILFDSRRELVFVQQLVAAQDEESDYAEELRYGRGGTHHDLLSAITHERLSGALDNMIYSLHITNTEFLPYQFKPLLTFFNSLSDGLLIADEVGLGKTIEAGLIWTELCMREHARTMLVICPSALRLKWQEELRNKFNTEAKIVNAVELKEVVARLQTGALRSGVFIAGLQGIRPRASQDEDSTSSSPSTRLLDYLKDEIGESDLFDLLILDEAHQIRNPSSRSYEIIVALRNIAKRFLFLSATPIQTSQSNLFTLLNLIDRETFMDESDVDFRVRMNEPVIRLMGQLATKTVSVDEFQELLAAIVARRQVIFGKDVYAPMLERLRKNTTALTLLSPRERIKLLWSIQSLDLMGQYITRTCKREVQEFRVKRSPYDLTVEMNPAEAKLYELLTQTLRRYCAQKDTPYFLLSTYQKYFASCIPAACEAWLESEDPNTAEDGQPESLEEHPEESTTTIRQNIVRALREFPGIDSLANNDSKFEKLAELLQGLEERGTSKSIIFSFYKRTLRHLASRLTILGYSVIRIDGDTSMQERYAAIHRFREERRCILLTSEVSSEGIDLQFVNCLINYDLPWNPARIEQRIGRLDRIGQKKKVILIYNFVTQGTIEELIYRRLFSRLRIFEAALGINEAVLGEKIAELTENIFKTDLSQKEVALQIEHSALVLENLEQHRKEAEKDSFAYSYMQDLVRRTEELERYVLDGDLHSYVADLCARDPGNSRLIEAQDGLYQLQMSVGLRAEFENFLSKADKHLDSTELCSNDNLLLRFRNKQEDECRGVERVRQNHPLIRFAAYWHEEHRRELQKTAFILFKVPADLGPQMQKFVGRCFVYRIESWQLKTRMGGEKRALSYAALDFSTGEHLDEEQAELLVSSAARRGQKLLPNERTMDSEQILECEGDLAIELGDRALIYFEELEGKTKADAQVRIEQYRKALEKSKKAYEAFISKLQDTSEKGREGRLKVRQNRYEARTTLLNTKIAQAEKAMEGLDKDQVHLCSGVILVRG